MLFHIPEHSCHILICAFDSKPDNLDQFLGGVQASLTRASLQLVDLDQVAGSRYMLHATLNALKSFNSAQAISKTLRMEMLLYIAASRQITEAIRLVGLRPGTKRVVSLLVGTSSEQAMEGERLLNQLLNNRIQDEFIDEWSNERVRRVRATFGIGLKEISATKRKNEAISTAVERLAIERSALLAIKK